MTASYTSIFRKEGSVRDVEGLRCTEVMVFCSYWTCSEGFKDGFVLSPFDEDVVADAVQMQDCERVVIAHVL